MLKRLHLGNFRNYQELTFEPPPGLVILSGANGTGKSNLCEGIFYLGCGYSYRMCHDETMLSFGAEFFSLRGEMQYGGLSYLMEATYQAAARHKLLRVNGKRELPGKSASYLPVVIFSPADLLVLQGAPGIRRRFLDLVAVQVRPQHAAALHQYQAVLLQRNNLLKQGAVRDQLLQTWNEQLAVAGARVLLTRVYIFRQLMELCSKIHTTLGGSGCLEGVYASDVLLNESGEIDENQCRTLFLNALQHSRQLELRYRATVVGPHRDDLKFYRDGHEARLFCSQGEQRLIALSLKVGQNRLLAIERQIEPLLLLDDVFSELDQQRRELLLGEFTRRQQVIATTTSYSGKYSNKTDLTPEITIYQL